MTQVGYNSVCQYLQASPAQPAADATKDGNADLAELTQSLKKKSKKSAHLLPECLLKSCMACALA